MPKKTPDKTTSPANPNSQSARDELRSFIERYEQLESEQKTIMDAKKEVMAEAKGRGYDVKVLRKIVAERKRNADDVAEEEAILDMYRAALGMASYAGQGDTDSGNEDDLV